MKTYIAIVGMLVLGVVYAPQVGGAELEAKVPKKKTVSTSMQLLMSVETPFQQDLKALAELIVEPRDLDNWKQRGVVSQFFPSLLGKSRHRLPKHFLVNLVNPFAGKEYGYIDPVAPYRGPRTGRNGKFNVKTSDMQGVGIFGSQW